MKNKYYTFSEDGLLWEELTIENYANYRRKKVVFCDGGSGSFGKNEMIERLAGDMKQKDLECRKYLHGEGLLEHGEKGRFAKGNIDAKKMFIEAEDIYLLYLLCGTMEKVAEQLGVSRQTVSKLVKQYKEHE